jgi:hypothetical protein
LKNGTPLRNLPLTGPGQFGPGANITSDITSQALDESYKNKSKGKAQKSKGKSEKLDWPPLELGIAPTPRLQR